MSGLKVTFSDKNNRFQYDGHAHRVKVVTLKKKGGKLYLGDRDSCSMVQLKHRNISHVVNTDVDQHNLCREDNIEYCKIDPVDDKRDCLEKAFRFIDAALESGKNTLVTCHTGYGKSACTIIYYLMKRDTMTLADAHRVVEDCRPGIRCDSRSADFRPSLVTLLQDVEKKLFKGQPASTRLDGRILSYTDGKPDRLPVAAGRSNGPQGAGRVEAKMRSKSGSSLGAVKAVAYLLVLFLFLLLVIFLLRKFVDKR